MLKNKGHWQNKPMTVLEVEPGFSYYLSKVKQRVIEDGPLKGYTEDYQEVYSNGILLRPGDLVYVKDRYEDEWIRAEFVDWRDEGIARVDNEEYSWRYMLISSSNSKFNYCHSCSADITERKQNETN